MASDTSLIERDPPRIDAPHLKGLRFQASSKLAAEVIGRLLQFALIYAAQRLLGPANYGIITYGLAVGVVLAPVTDLGMQLIVTREIARDGQAAPRLAGLGLALKLILTLGAVGLLLPISLLRPARCGLRHVHSGAGRHRLLLLQNTSVTYSAVCSASNSMRLSRCCCVCWCLPSASLRCCCAVSVNSVAVAYLLGNLLAALLGYLWLRRRFFMPRLTGEAI